MPNRFVIAASDKETAADIQQELASVGIEAELQPGSQVLSFGARLKAFGVELDFTPQELLELAEGLPPAAVNALFNTLETFGNRVRLFVNGKPTDVSNQQKMHEVFAAFSK